MSHLLSAFFSTPIDANPIQHIHRLETTTLHDDKLSSISKLVTLSANRDYDYFFLREGEGVGKDDRIEVSSSSPHRLILNRLIDLLCQDVENESLAENYITILLNIISRLVQHKDTEGKLALLLQNVNFIPILVACLSKSSPYMLKNTLRLFFLLLQYDYSTGFLLLRNNGLRNFVALLQRGIAERDGSPKHADTDSEGNSDLADAEFTAEDEQLQEVKTFALQFLILLTQKEIPPNPTSLHSTRPLNQMERHQKEEIMKFLAFEGIFDILFQIIAQSSSASLKALSLELMKNLIANSESNQRHFIQGQYLPQLLRWIQLNPVTKQQILTLATVMYSYDKVYNQIRSLALETLRVLLTKQQDARKLLCTSHRDFLFTTILYLALMKDIKSSLNELPEYHDSHQHPFALPDANSEWNIDYIENVEIECLNILGLALDSNKGMQQGFVELQDLIFDQKNPCSALVRLCRMAISHPIERIQNAAMNALSQFLHNNEEGQYLVATTYKLRSQSRLNSTEAGISCGISLTDALFNSESPEIVFRACNVFIHILQQNPQCEMILLEKPYDDSVTPPKSFFGALVRDLLKNLREKDPKTKLKVLVGQLKLVCQCVYNSEDAAHKFVSSASGLMFIVDYLLQHENDEHLAYAHTRGLISLLIGLIMLYYPSGAAGGESGSDTASQSSSDSPSESTTGGTSPPPPLGSHLKMSKKALHDLVLRKIGLRRLEQEFTKFNNLLDRESDLTESSTGTTDASQLYNTRFGTQYKLWRENILIYLRKPEEERLTSMKDIKAMREKQQQKSLDQLNALRASYDAQVQELQATIQYNQQETNKLHTTIQQLQQQITSLTTELKESQNLAASAQEVDELKLHIEKLNQQLEETNEIHASSMENLQKQLQQKESELQKLTDVYNDMDTEHDEELDDLRNQNQKLKSTMQSMEQQRQEQQDAVQRMTQEVQMLRAELAQKKNSVSEDQLNNLHREFANEKQHLAALYENEKQQLLAQFGHERQQFAGAMETQRHEMEERISLLQQEYDTHTQQTQQIHQHTDALEQHTHALEQQNQQLEQRIQQLNLKVQEKSMQAGEQQKIIEQLHHDLEQRNMVVSQYESVILQRDQRIRDLEEQFARFQQEGPNAQLQKRVEELEGKIVDLIKENKDKDVKIVELEKDNEDLMEIVETLENKNEQLKKS